MIADLSVPFADASAAALRFSLTADRQPALSARTLLVGGVSIELRILGSSHQALVSAGADAVCETVACLPSDGSGVPRRHLAKRGALGYSFSSHVEQLAPAPLALRARTLRDQAEHDDHALAGVFPGAPEALTLLVVESLRGGVGWTTHHVYPQSGEIVVTRSEVVIS